MHVEFFELVSHEGVDDWNVGVGTWIEDHDDQAVAKWMWSACKGGVNKNVYMPFNSPKSLGFAYIMALILIFPSRWVDK